MIRADARSLFSAIEKETPFVCGTLWVAPFAHIATPTKDDRVFHWTGETVQDDPVPLVLDGGVVGRASAIQVRNGYLVAAGDVDDPDVSRRMGSGELRPIPDFQVRRTFRDAGQLHVYSSRVLAITLGISPAWDDASLRFVFPHRTIPAVTFVEAPDQPEPEEDEE
jgi:hypothetical protein